MIKNPDDVKNYKKKLYKIIKINIKPNIIQIDPFEYIHKSKQNWTWILKSPRRKKYIK